MQVKHRWLWMQHNGEIPAGMCCVFKDKDTNNCVIENLMLITRKQNLFRNRNYIKASISLRKKYQRERVRICIGLPPISKLAKRIVNFR